MVRGLRRVSSETLCDMEDPMLMMLVLVRGKRSKQY